MADRDDTSWRDEVAARSDALALRLAERSGACRSAGAVAEATVADFIDAGLNRLLQPVAYGGWALGADTAVAAGFALGRGDAAQGWVLTGYGEAAHLAGCFGAEAQADVWGTDPAALVALSLGGDGRIAAADGGWRVSGRWPGVAGAGHARWLLLGGVIAGDEAGAEALVLVPVSQARVIDDWQVAGLEGAGAKSVVLEDVAVPAHRVLIGLARRSSLALAAVPLGAVAAMIEVFAGQCRDKLRRGRRTADDFITGLRMAESRAEIDAGYLALIDAAVQTAAEAKAGALLPERRALNALKAGHGVRLAQRAADRVFAAAGAKAILQVNPMQRFLLDVHALAAQDIFAWERTAAAWGQLQFDAQAD